MKKIVSEVECEGLEKLLGEKVLLMCARFFYHGKLIGVNSEDVLLQDAYIVYETGSWSEGGFTDAQKASDEMYVRIDAIESYLVKS